MIGSEILQYRARHKLTQREMAELLGIPLISLGRYENGGKMRRAREIEISEKLKNLDNGE